MAVTQNEYTGNNSTTTYSFTFPYLKASEIKASLDGVVTTAFTNPTATTIQFNTAPGTGVKIKIYRETDTDSLAATFYAGSAIKSEDLNDNFTQNLYTTQEVNARYVSKLGGTMTGDLNLGEDVSIKFEGATDNAHETTLTVADPTADRSIVLPNVSGTVVTTGDTGTVATGMIANDAINGTKIADDSIDSEHVAADSLDTEHYAPNSVDTTALGPDSVTNAKIADNAIDSEHYTDGSIDRVHLAADIIDGTKIADDSINSEHYAADSIDAEHYAPNSVDATALAHTSVTAGTYSATDLTVDAQGRITAASSGTIATSEIAADAIDGTKLADNAVDSEHYTDGSIDHVHLANDVIDGDNIQDDVVNSEHIAAGALDNEHYAAGSITSDKLNAATVVTNSEQAAASANDTSFFTTSASDARYFNVSTGDTIKDGQTFPDNDTTIATTAAINDRIIDLVDDVGGFVPIANETSFPTANPDVNNGAGTLVSIKALSSNLVSNGSGVATIANGAGSGNTVTINGLANSTTYAATFGMIVETTSTLHTYTFHRQVPIATEVSTVAGSISNVNSVAGSISNVNSVASNATNVNTVAGSITNVNNVGGSISNVNTVAGNLSGVNSFGERYRVASSAPGSGNDEGDLYFDTTANELKIYNGSAWQSGVTASGNFASITGNTFTGANTYQDNVKAQFGTGNDLRLSHDGTDSFLDHRLDSGLLRINAKPGAEVHITTDGPETLAKFIPNGAVELYHNNVLKLQTTADGCAFNDDVKLQLGNSQDLQIKHSGDDSIISHDTGSGLLRLNAAAGGVIALTKSGPENLARFIPDGAVELYHDNSKKLETSAAGVVITGVTASDPTTTIYHSNADVIGEAIRFGRTDIPTIRYHSIKAEHSGGAGDNMLQFYVHNASDTTSQTEVLELTGDGKVHVNDNIKFECGTGGDLHIYHDGTNSIIDNNTGDLIIRADGDDLKILAEDDIVLRDNDDSTNFIRCINGGAVELYYDGVKKLETKSWGVEWSGDLENNSDSSRIKLGAGDDLQIYHNGTNSYIDDSGTGNLFIRSNEVRINKYTGEYMIKAVADGSVELYYDNSKKFETISGGATVTGDLNVSGEFNLVGGSDADKYLDTQIGTNAFTIRKVTGGDTGHETMAVFRGDAECALYYNNAKKFETTSGGVNVTGALTVNGSALGSANFVHCVGINAPNSDYATFTGLTSTNISMYKFIWTGLTGGSAGNDNVILGIQVQTGGSTWETGSNYYTKINSVRWNANAEVNSWDSAQTYGRVLYYEGNNIHSGELCLPMNVPNASGAKGHKQMYGKAMGNGYMSDYWIQVKGSTVNENSITGLRFYANGSDFGHEGRIDLYKLTF